MVMGLQHVGILPKWLFSQQLATLCVVMAISVSCNVALGEPNYFSPNPDSAVVDAIGPPASAIASPDIPNSAKHFRTILFSPSGIGESLWLDR